MDVTPQERRIWGSWTMLGFWFSDALNAQGWEAPAAIIAVGLTWYAHGHQANPVRTAVLISLSAGAKPLSASS
jgi:hypothetical protein